MEYMISRHNRLISCFIPILIYWCCKIFRKIQYLFVDRLKSNLVLVENTKNQQYIELQAERMLEEHGNSILRLAYSYMHNMVDAEDVLQDTLLQYMRTVPDFQDRTHETAWLLRVAINISKNKIKYNKKRETVELDESLILEHEENLKFVWEAVSRLSLSHREIVHFYYHEGYSTGQIAEILQKKETTVRSLMFRAREKLKKILEEDYDFAD